MYLAHGAVRAAHGITVGGNDTLTCNAVLCNDAVTDDHGEGAKTSVAVVQHEERNAAQADIVRVGVAINRSALSRDLAACATVHVTARARVLQAVTQTGSPVTLNTNCAQCVTSDGIDKGGHSAGS
jgi:hypothetical protein